MWENLGYSTPLLKLLIAVSSFTPLLHEYILHENIASLFLFGLYTLLLYGLLTAVGRWYWLLAIPFLLLAAVLGPFMVLTRSNFSYNAISSVFESNLGESLEFMVSAFFLKYVLLSSAVIALPLVIARLPGIRSIRLGVVGSPLLIGIALTGIIGFSVANTSEARRVSYTDGLFPHYPLKQLVLIKQYGLETQLVISGYLNQAVALEVDQDLDNETTVILVIGEAARKSSMGIYGSRYATTPYLEVLAEQKPQQLVVFNQAFSVAPFTRVALPSMLSTASAENYSEIAHTPSIYKLVNQTDTETIYISNTGPQGFHDALGRVMLADNQAMIRAGGLLDGDMLDDLFATLSEETAGKQLITLQLAGSHFNYRQRYPRSQDCFTPDHPRAHYLSSIRYTDQVLSRIARYIDSLPRPIVILYLSDHGEYVDDEGDGIFGHGYRQMTRNEIEIPYLLIFNTAYVNANREILQKLNSRRDLRVSLDTTSHTILGLLGIGEPTYYQASYDLSADDFSENPLTIINRDMRISRLDDFVFREEATDSSHWAQVSKRPACRQRDARLQP